MFAPSKNALRNLAGAAAVALTFGALATPANADTVMHPLVDPHSPFMYNLSGSMKQFGVVGYSDRVRGFADSLVNSLESPADKTRAFLYPEENSTNMLVIGAVVPPKGLEAQPIPVCAQQNNKVLGTWAITNKGEVLSVAWNGPTTGEVVPGVGVKPACGAFLKANKSAINQLAQARANGTPAASAQPQAPAKISMPSN